MSSRKQLKKEINNTLGALIEEVYVKELSSPELDSKKSDKIIDEAISLFDDLIQKMHEAPEGKTKVTSQVFAVLCRKVQRHYLIKYRSCKF